MDNSLKDLRSAVNELDRDDDGYYTNKHERLQQLFQQQLNINEELVKRVEELEISEQRRRRKRRIG